MPFIPKLTPLAEIAKEAGDTILGMQKSIVKKYDNGNGLQEECDGQGDKWQQKIDRSIITDADIKANQIICKALAERFPRVAVVSEENSMAQNQAALKAKDRFETDPLDNTGGYIEGRDVFSVTIGRIVGDRPTEGVIYFPAKQELYYTGEDGKAYLQKGDASPQLIQVRKGAHDSLNVAVGFHEQNIDYLAGKDITTTLLSAQLRTCAIACGECDISGVNRGAGGFNTWDIVGPHAVLLAAGGDMVMEDGTPLRYSGDNVTVPRHIVGSFEALERCVPGYEPERADRLRA